MWNPVGHPRPSGFPVGPEWEPAKLLAFIVLTQKKIAATLTDWQQGKFESKSAADVAFAALKQALLTSVVLHIVRFDKPFFIHTDVSKVAVGAILEQNSEGEVRPIAFYSKNLTNAQNNSPLQYWHNEHVATPLAGGPSGLGRLNLPIEYLPGKANSAADALSRRWSYPGDSSQQVTHHKTAEDGNG